MIRDSDAFAGHHHLLMLFRTSGGESRDHRSKRFIKLRKKEDEFRTDAGSFVQKKHLTAWFIGNNYVLLRRLS